MTEIDIYTTRRCPWCIRAKALLERSGCRYREIDLTGDETGLRELVECTGRRTVPQIFISGVPVGGFEDLLALQHSGGLGPGPAAGCA